MRQEKDEPQDQKEKDIHLENQNEEDSKAEDTTASDFDEVELLKKPAKPFHLDLKSELAEIPDYHGYQRTAVKKRSKVSVFLKVIFGLIIVGLSIAFALVIIFASQDVFGMGKSNTTHLVEVPQSYSVSQIADMLEENGVINSAFLFKTYHKLAKIEGDFQYGTYSLNSNMSYDTIIDELQKYSSTQEEVKITFPEGLTLYEMAALLEKNKVCDSETFIETINTTEFGFDFEKDVDANPLRFHRLEGYAFPDTYNFFVKENPISVAKKLLKNYSVRVTDDMNDKQAATGLTQEQIMIVASIVQKEAGSTTEMKRVASVYLNRLKNPGDYARLQADPTREYANQLKLQMDIIDQKVIDAYNTYEGTGLPPGPICNPGLEAIQAVLSPEQTDYFYFCTNLKTGEFYYAQTLEEHNKNVRKAGLRQ